MMDYISGEFLLKNRPNGGTVVLRRTLLISVAAYLLAIGVRSRLELGAMWAFDMSVARKLVVDTIPWFGAIFAGTYVALYARFASQWNYLASLYNQIMVALAQHPPEGMTSSEILALWQAGFIEDAEELHLARKPMFASVIASMLTETAVRDAYVSYTPGGKARLDKLEAGVEAVLDRVRKKYAPHSSSPVSTSPASEAQPAPIQQPAPEANG
jgi:hypothetical protein